VGTNAFDSSNYFGVAEEPIVAVPAPLDNNTIALRHALYLAADRAYKSAVNVFEAKRAHRETLANEQSPIDDFSSAPVERSWRNTTHSLPSIETHAAFARCASSIFLQHPDVHRSSVRIVAQILSRTFVDSAGTMIEDSTPRLRVETTATTQADDGMVLVDRDTFASLDFSDMPSGCLIAHRAEEIATWLDRLRAAPIAPDYAGPVLFEGQAAPQIFRTLLADELSATPFPEPRETTEAASSYLSTRIGSRILPLGFDVTDDPTQVRMAQHPLLGSYAFDDQGVRAQAVRLVEDGVLKNLLSSRTPSRAVAASNGHGRAGGLGDARGRVSNLWLTSRSGLSPTALRSRLLQAAKREGLQYAMVITRLDEATNPTELYRVWNDGRIELLRGARLEGLRTRDMRQILAAGRDANAHSYWASNSPWPTPSRRSGSIPTTIVAPSVLFPDADIMAPVPPFALLPLAPRNTNSTHGRARPMCE